MQGGNGIYIIVTIFKLKIKLSVLQRFITWAWKVGKINASRARSCKVVNPSQSSVKDIHLMISLRFSPFRNNNVNNIYRSICWHTSFFYLFLLDLPFHKDIKICYKIMQLHISSCQRVN